MVQQQHQQQQLLMPPASSSCSVSACQSTIAADLEVEVWKLKACDRWVADIIHLAVHHCQAIHVIVIVVVSESKLCV